MTILIAILLLIVVPAVGVIFYNRLIRLKTAVQEGLAQVDVQLQRRSDLIPNLVNTVKGYAAHESATFEAVIAARSASLGAQSVRDRASADTALTGALRGLFALAEAYPDLKASANFLALQEELSATENKISFARQRYNDLVRALNTAVETIPTKFFTGIARVGAAEFYEIEEGARSVPNVSF